MSKYNKISEKPMTTQNLAGGDSYTLSPEYELISLLLTSFLSDKYYSSESEQLNRLESIFDKLNSQGKAEFAAKAAIYARQEFGMRSVSQVLAANIAAKVSGESWTRSFFARFPRRVDDMTELVSYYQTRFANKTNEKGYKRALPNAMKVGLSKAFDSFDGYQLAKYRGEGHNLSLLDLVNLVHPVPNSKNSTALNLLMNDKLRSTSTWEAMVSEAGKQGKTQEEVNDLKGDAFAELINSRKIGYFALLKNLRNVLELSPETVDSAIEMLTNKNLISKSLVFPFRFLNAYSAVSALENVDTELLNKMLGAIDDAINISVSNCPEFEGGTVIHLDGSGSMGNPGDDNSPAGIGSFFAAVLLKRNLAADLIGFADDANYIKVNRRDSVLTIKNSIANQLVSGGTDFHAPVNAMTKAYDRMIILSDMQGWAGGYDTPVSMFERYKAKYNCNPKIYSFDLAGYGTVEYPENGIYQISGFSDKIFTLMGYLEKDRKALVHAVEAVVI